MNLPRRAAGLRPRFPRRRALLAAALLAALATPAAADEVTDWNQVTVASATLLGGPPQQARTAALVHIAIHDALNAIDPRYESYAVLPAAPASASPNAAIAQAAHDVLHALIDPLPASPNRTAALTAIDNRYAQTLGLPPYSSSETQGMAVGANAAEAILALRNGDGSATPTLPYTLAPGPGVHQPTAPNFPAPAFNGWARMLPFAMRRPAQFRMEPGEIFDLSGAAYARDFNEVKQVGSLAARTAAPDSPQTDIARFWPAGGANWNASAVVIASGRNLDRWQHARLFALLNIAQVDGTIAVFDTKYAYNFWRPVAAIRWLPSDGNPATTPDADWLPLFSTLSPPGLTTPPYPDYPCGLPNQSGAAVEVLRRFFGTDALPFSRTVALPPVGGLPGKTVTRSYATLRQAAAESASARVYAGIHFRSGCVQGVRQGEKVGRFAIQHYLRPLR